MAGGGGAFLTSCHERVALDARASLARRVGASAVLLLIDRIIASPMCIRTDLQMRDLLPTTCSTSFHGRLQE